MGSIIVALALFIQILIMTFIDNHYYTLTFFTFNCMLFFGVFTVHLAGSTEKGKLTFADEIELNLFLFVILATPLFFVLSLIMFSIGVINIYFLNKFKSHIKILSDNQYINLKIPLFFNKRIPFFKKTYYIYDIGIHYLKSLFNVKVNSLSHDVNYLTFNIEIKG